MPKCKTWRSFEGVVTSKGQLRIEKGTRVRFARIRGGIAIYPKQFGEIKQFRGIFADLACRQISNGSPIGSLGETVSVTPGDAIRAARLQAQYNLPSRRRICSRLDRPSVRAGHSR